MEKLKIEATRYTPEIDFDANAGVLLVKGKSYPENCNEFYDPIIVWLEAYFENSPPKTKVVFEIAYYNSSTSKVLFDIFDMLEGVKGSGVNLEIIWQFDPDNEAAREMGEEFQEDFQKLDIKLVEVV